MAYVDTDNQIEINQPFISNALPSSSDDVDGFIQGNLLNPQLESSIPKTHPWLSSSTGYNSAFLSLNAADDLYGRPEPWSERAPFQLDHFFSESPTLGVPLEPNTMTNLELKVGDSIIFDSAEMTATIPDVAPFRCNEPGCDNQRIYPTLAALRKHHGKHSRPYTCKHSSCNYRRFGDKAGLTRHSREVHSTEVHYCPFISCNRHTRGFPRKYNLMIHQKNSHGNHKTRYAKQSFDYPQRASKYSSVNPHETEDVAMESGQVCNGDPNRDHNTESAVERSDVFLGDLNKLQKKLRDLKAARVEIDQDIATIERALGLVEDNSS